MRDKIMEIIYDKIKDINFYNYDNDEKLKNIEEQVNKIVNENGSLEDFVTEE